MKMVGSSTPNPKRMNTDAATAGATGAGADAPASTQVDEKLREEEDDRVLRELVSKPAGHRGPLTSPSVSKNENNNDDDKNNENDYVVLKFPSKKDRTRNCESNLLPRPIDGGASENYHALCGTVGVLSATAAAGGRSSDISGGGSDGWKSRSRTNSARLSSVSITPPKDGMRGIGAEAEGFGRSGAEHEVFGDDADWQRRCEEFNRGDFHRSSSTSAPSR